MKVTYSVAEAAALLGVGESTMRRMIRRDLFPHAHFAGRILIPEWGPAEWLRQQALTTRNQSDPGSGASSFEADGAAEA